MRPDPAGQGVPIERPLFHCMLGLVLANVVFVHLTEAAGLLSLAVLTGATLAAPWLRRFRGRWWYVSTWTLAAFGALGLLVAHATGGELSRLLEDGLLLALLCQVHLLNNLRDEHRPDLLFINAFLIALITGYITADMGFAVAFFAFVPVFVGGLAFLSVGANGKARLARGDQRRIVLDALRRSGILVVATGVMFMVWPRDFQREALITRYFELPEPSGGARVDFAEELRLERLEASSARARLALTLERTDGASGEPPALWRGAALGNASRTGEWTEGEDPGQFRETPWDLAEDGRSMTRPGQPRWTVHVTRHVDGSRRLFLPVGAVSVTLDGDHTAGRLQVRRDGGVSYSNPGRLGYTVGIAADADGRGAGAAPASAREIERSLHTASAAGLARALREGAGPPRTAMGDVAAFSAELRRRYPYRAPGTAGAAETLHEFLTTDAGGHCELFASALAVMSRSAGIPARVATGFRVDPLPANGELKVMSSSAHAWVEVLDGETGHWISFDPTPASSGGTAEGGQGPLARAQAALAEIWGRVTGFDGEQRAELMAWLRRNVALVAAVAGGLLAALAVRQRRRARRRPASVVRLAASLKTCGIDLAPGETAREALERARSASGAGADQLDALEQAVLSHEHDRYAA